MHAIASSALRTAHRTALRPLCRKIAGRRHPIPLRTFSRSSVAFKVVPPAAPEDPPAGVTNSNSVTPKDEGTTAELENGEGKTETATTATTSAIEGKTKSHNGNGNGGRRGMRNSRMQGIPQLELPPWFLQHNLDSFDSKDAVPKDVVEVICTVEPAAEIKDSEPKYPHYILRPEGGTDVKDTSTSFDQDTYSIQVEVFDELLEVLGIRLRKDSRPPSNIDLKNVPRPDLLLHCPKKGAYGFLGALVSRAAYRLQADVLRLDAEDFAQILGPYLGENIAWTNCETSLLGYESQVIAGRSESSEPLEQDEDNDDLDSVDKNDHFKKAMKGLELIRAARIREIERERSSPFERVSTTSISLDKFVQLASGKQRGSSKESSDNWADLKLSAALESIVDAAQKSASTGLPTGRNLIIQIGDYLELEQLSKGKEILEKLRQIVSKRWMAGDNIAIVGMTTAELDLPLDHVSLKEIRQLQSDIIYANRQSILIPPGNFLLDKFAAEESAYRRSINIRHIENLLSNMRQGGQPIEIEHESLEPMSNVVLSMESNVWTYARVYRIAQKLYDSVDESNIINATAFMGKFDELRSSDEVKKTWANSEIDIQKKIRETRKAMAAGSSLLNKKLEDIKKTCNPYEKKLFGGIFAPTSIRATFDDVHVPASTIEAMKSLTSLSLTRPEAFAYGVLATDKIPGVLLYGPPGTGKTLLAKAVAKESGATVLEVTGSDLNDKYVGEGEKNVKAVFTLAKKLKPCVVFIDEADAILASRGGDSVRKSHRELINQFLREWDGMDDMSAFIMVATNRPFDLDEAVLRRLPRRVLIDLPLEKDREAILKLHLKGEMVAPTVSFPNLAKETPFYSGSDLKNLAVAAALACVREEIAASKTAAEKNEEYTYPALRTLEPKHFTIAMQEISASVSSDMSTLSAIRKFDERYGDRKGRKKKGASLGFGGTTEETYDSESARIRETNEEATKEALLEN